MSLQLKATNELYEKCKRTIEKACWNAYKKNPVIEINDYRSYANEIFMDAVKSYKVDRGTQFNSWLTTQLLLLKTYANKCRITSSSYRKQESFVLSLDSKHENLEGQACTLHDIGSHVNEIYAFEISSPLCNMDWLERMHNVKPFSGQLSDDGKILVNDILDGNVSKKDNNGVPRFEKGNKLYVKLTARQLWVRLYKKHGWTFDRVRCARQEVERMLKCWEPCKLPEVEGVEEPVKVQDELF